MLNDKPPDVTQRIPLPLVDCAGSLYAYMRFISRQLSGAGLLDGLVGIRANNHGPDQWGPDEEGDHGGQGVTVRSA